MAGKFGEFAREAVIVSTHTVCLSGQLKPLLLFGKKERIYFCPGKDRNFFGCASKILSGEKE